MPNGLPSNRQNRQTNKNKRQEENNGKKKYQNTCSCYAACHPGKQLQQVHTIHIERGQKEERRKKEENKKQPDPLKKKKRPALQYSNRHKKRPLVLSSLPPFIKNKKRRKNADIHTARYSSTPSKPDQKDGKGKGGKKKETKRVTDDMQLVSDLADNFYQKN